MMVRDSTPRIYVKMQDAKTIEGGYYKPDVDENGILRWTPSKEHMPELPESNIKGKPGYTPIKGVDYFDGAPGKDGTDANVTTENITRALGYTPADNGDVNQLKDDLATKLPKSPADWGPWTAEEQAAARERMGIPGDFELIEEIVLEDDVSIVERTQEPDGTPYNFKKIVVALTSAKTEYKSRTIYTKCYCGSVYVSSFSMFAENLNYYKRSIWRGQIESSELRFSTVDNTFIYGMQGSVSGDASVYKETPNCIIVGDNITKISTYCDKGLSIPKGFLMQIYGVRAV